MDKYIRFFCIFFTRRKSTTINYCCSYDIKPLWYVSIIIILSVYAGLKTIIEFRFIAAKTKRIMCLVCIKCHHRCCPVYFQPLSRPPFDVRGFIFLGSLTHGFKGLGGFQRLKTGTFLLFFFIYPMKYFIQTVHHIKDKYLIRTL